MVCMAACLPACTACLPAQLPQPLACIHASFPACRAGDAQWLRASGCQGVGQCLVAVLAATAPPAATLCTRVFCWANPAAHVEACGACNAWALPLWLQVVPLSGSMRPGGSAGGSAGTSPAAFLHEARMLHGLRHRCIVQLAGVALTKAQDKALLIMELLPGGDLFKALNLRDRSSNRVFGWACKGKRVALDVASALAFLHNRRVMHYDLKVRHCGLDA